MLRNYLKTAFRNLWKNKSYGFLNVFGLAVGIACAALIFLWVEDELNYNSYNQREMLIGKLSRIFALLAIVITCLGLFGLSAYTAERRTKEIGIRKVLGASVSGITGLLSKDFLKLVILSSIISFPLAWWIINKWFLEDYEYRIQINWWVFIVAGILAIGIALLTISFQAIKAALANPVKSLRTE
jgi:ABC-type antimicrobial peptide transport system permease subunit